MKKAVIIGCGFGGLFAAKYLSKFRRHLEVTVIDKQDNFNFLPMLPDIIGRGIDSRALAFPIKKLSSKYSFNFIKEEVVSLGLDKKSVFGAAGNLAYDYLLVSSGSQTNFYGNEEIKKYAYKLDDAVDGALISKALTEKEYDVYLIGGGGYTGVEAATNLRLYLEKNHQNKRIIIAERANSILWFLPQWIRDYTAGNLRRMGVEILTNVSVNKIEGTVVSLSSGEVFNNCMLLWTAGVEAAAFIKGLNAEKNPQGRVKVDEFLRLRDDCFIIGDAAIFTYKGLQLRMAVQFAIAQGVTAAKNIIRSTRGLPLCKYKPLDPGYVIPMANNKSCGRILGVNLKGILPTALHYLMCFYRIVGMRNKFCILKMLFPVA